MKFITCVITLFVTAMVADLFADTLVSVDKANALVTVETASGLKSYRLKPFTEVKLNGTVTTLDNLKSGMKVTVQLADRQTATRIDATGNVTTGFGAPTPQPPLGSAAGGQQALRRITIRGKFEFDIIKVQRGALWIEHKSFDKPAAISINGVNWQPQWQGNVSERFETFKSPLLHFGDAKVEVRKIKGRSEFKEVIPPTAENDHTLSIFVADAPAGADEYEIRITW